MTTAAASVAPVTGKHELLDGEHILLPPVSQHQNAIAHSIYAALERIADGDGIRRVWMRAAYQIDGKNWLVPDVSVTHHDQVRHRTFEGAPAVAVEVISEFTLERDLHRRRRIYRENGALEFWVLYPDSHTAHVYHGHTGEIFTEELRSRVFPEVRINLNRLFE